MKRKSIKINFRIALLDPIVKGTTSMVLTHLKFDYQSISMAFRDTFWYCLANMVTTSYFKFKYFLHYLILPTYMAPTWVEFYSVAWHYLVVLPKKHVWRHLVLPGMSCCLTWKMWYFCSRAHFNTLHGFGGKTISNKLWWNLFVSTGNTPLHTVSIVSTVSTVPTLLNLL